MTLHSLAVAAHVAGGVGAVAVGLFAAVAPKFGRRANWHRRLGRLYLALLGTSSVVGIPLAFSRDNTYLLLVGAFTAAFLAFGWRTIILARRERNRVRADRLLRQHVIWMGGSYIGAWSGFFANNFVFGTDTEAAIWFYAFGPTVIGAVVLAVTVPRVQWRRPTSPPTRVPPTR